MNMSLVLRIRIIREAQGATVTWLADKVGVSIPHMSEIERGKKNLNNHLLEKISKALNVEPFELIKPNGASEPDTLDILSRQLDAQGRGRLADYAQGLLDSQSEK